jgi:hypothetical protein
LKLKILLLGGSGFIGSYLAQELKRAGHEVFSYSRQYDKKHFGEIDGIINLRGENVGAKGWSPSQKKKIYDSRLVSLRLLKEDLMNFFKEQPREPLKFIFQASAVGFYASSQEIQTEESGAGDSFLSKVCQDVEEELKSFDEKICERKIIGRFGVVLSSQGGMMASLIPIFKWGMGAILGSGKQWMSWIHLEDCVSIIRLLCEKYENTGNMTINIVSPNPCTNADFSRALAEKYSITKRLLPFKIPACLLSFLLGEKKELLLSSQRILSKSSFYEHYVFKFKCNCSQLSTFNSQFKDLL